MFWKLAFRLPLLTALMVFAGGCNGDDPDPEDPCDGIICDTPPNPDCDGDEIVFFAEAGVCAEGACEYPVAERVACDEQPAPECDGDDIVFFAEAGVCVLGACDYPVAERVACDEVPAPECDGDQVVTFGAGTCEGAQCVYPELNKEDCNAPPASYCDGDEEVVFVALGVCGGGTCEYPEASRVLCESISMVCEPAEGECVDPCAGISCPPLDMWCEDGVAFMMVGHCDWRTAQCVYEEVQTDLIDCGFGYNFDFEEWASGEPLGFIRQPTEGFRAIEDSSTVNTGQRSARLETDIPEAGHLRASMPFEFLEEGQVYTFHLWYRFEGRPGGGSSALLRPMIEVADAGGEVSPEWIVSGPTITAAANEWTEVTLTTPPMAADRAQLRPLLQMRGESGETVVAHVDDWAVTMPITRLLNSRRDLDSLLFLFNGNFWVASGIDNRGMIYPTARSAEVEADWDQLLFTWVGRPSEGLVAAPWNKAGQVAGPGAGGVLFVVLQNPTGYCEWRRYDPGSGAWNLITTNSTCSDRVGDPAGINYALEGVLDLVAHLDGVNSPAEVPTWFHFAASHWESGAGGALVPTSQTPASRNADGNIDATETHRAHRATFLSGKVTYYFP